MNWRLARGKPPETTPPPEEVRPGQHEFDELAPYYDVLMRGVPYEAWVEYVERLMRVAGTRVERVLDLCCGTGKVGSLLRQRGYRVWGVDLAEKMVRACGGQRPPLPAAVMDATCLGLPRECLDAVVCLYDSLNYLLDPAGLQECFVRVQEALRPGGVFIFDLNTPRALQIGLFTQHNLHSRNPLNYRWVAHWDEATELCRVDMWFRWQGDGRMQEFEETHYQRAYSERMVRTWLQAAGFARVRSYEAYTLNPVGALSDRMYLLAQKGEGA